MNDLPSDEGSGSVLFDDVNSSGVDRIVAIETAEISLERDAYRQVAIENKVALNRARADVDAAAEATTKRRRLRAV